MSAASLFVGVSKRVITPKLGCELAGFDARKGVAARVHDDLFASVILISKGNETVALVSLDLIGIAQETTNAIRAAVHASRGIAERNVILCATHTHCAPVTIKHFFNGDQNLDAQYLGFLHSQVINAIEEAYDQREPGIVKSGLVRIEGVAVNRRTENGKPVDDDAGVLLAEDMNGKVKAVLVNFACHPTVLGPNTLDVTRDFPHYLVKSLNERLGEDVLPLYFNGTEGDISVGHKSFLSAVGVIAPFRTYKKAQEIGERLAAGVINGLPTLIEEALELLCEHSIVSLPLKTYSPLTEMQQVTIDARTALTAAENIEVEGKPPTTETILRRQDFLFARIEEYYASLREGNTADTLPIEVSVVRIGGSALLFVPGEVFVEIGLAIRSGSPFPRTMIFGLANDYIGYVPTIEQSKQSGYEVVAARVTPEASLMLEEDSVALLKVAFAREA